MMNSKTLRLRLVKKNDDSYSIIIGNSILKDAMKEILFRLNPSKAVIVTDSNLFRIYEDLFSFYQHEGIKTISFPAGEAQKNIKTVESLFSSVAGERLDRNGILIALGGGVTGDITGFLASIYMRGIRFIQVPTSLLAISDSSIGGKTGVDTPAGKNMMGSFCQPKAVIIDTDFLNTLPQDEFLNGMAEIIKHAVIMDRKYFDMLSSNLSSIQKKVLTVLADMIHQSCRIKAFVVERDEKEGGLREILNFGHTVGHAIESASEFQIPHGFSVALGMAAESDIAARKGFLSSENQTKIVSLLDRYGLLKYSGHLDKLGAENIIDKAFSDKKNKGCNIKAVMIREIGKVFDKNNKYSFNITTEEIRSAVSTLMKR